MTELKFDSEQLTSCPMNETATKEECLECRYIKGLINFETENIKVVNCYVEGGLACSYEDVFPELKDFAGLEDCIYIKGVK